MATNGTSQKVRDNETVTLFKSPWSVLSSGQYSADIYKVTFTVSLPSGASHDVWYRSADTEGWGFANPMFQDPRAYINVNSSASEATITTYVYVDIRNVNGQLVAAWQPETPQDAKVAYTIAKEAGTPPVPPLDVSLSGTSSLCPGESGSWTASVSGGTSPYSYDWYYRKDSGTWYSQSETSDSFSRSMPTVNNSMDIKVTVTDDDNTQASDTKLVYKEGGCDDDGGGGGGGGLLSVDPADSTKVGAKSLLQRQPIPDEFALDQNSPNPAHGTVTIRFALPEASEVSLVVYDIMG